MAHEIGTTVDKVAAGGPGLAFIAYPRALAKVFFIKIEFYFVLKIMGQIDIFCQVDNFSQIDNFMPNWEFCVDGFFSKDLKLKF